MQSHPFLLLAVAAIVFIISTWRFDARARGIIWLLGAAVLGIAFLAMHVNERNTSLIPALMDFVHKPGDSLMAMALAANKGFIGRNLAALYDVFFAMSVVLGLFALIAFAPGEGIAGLMRPLCFIVLGALGGAALTLAVVSIGFGAFPQRNAYFGSVSKSDVVDGDTIKMGDVSLRLAGIDAPELGQTCKVKDTLVPCGKDARQAVVDDVTGALVMCKRDAKGDDKYGRPLVTCMLRSKSHGEIDLAGDIAAKGFAVAAVVDGATDPTYKAAIDKAQSARQGIWAGCMLKPKVWREDREARQRFEEPNGWQPNDVISAATCGPPPPPTIVVPSRKGDL